MTSWEVESFNRPIFIVEIGNVIKEPLCKQSTRSRCFLRGILPTLHTLASVTDLLSKHWKWIKKKVFYSFYEANITSTWNLIKMVQKRKLCFFKTLMQTYQLVCVCVCELLSHVWLHDPKDCSLPGSSVQGFFRQEYWSELHFLLQNERVNHSNALLRNWYTITK